MQEKEKKTMKLPIGTNHPFLRYVEGIKKKIADATLSLYKEIQKHPEEECSLPQEVKIGRGLKIVHTCHRLIATGKAFELEHLTHDYAFYHMAVVDRMVGKGISGREGKSG